MIEGPAPQTPRDICGQKKGGDIRGVFAGHGIAGSVPLKIRALIEAEIDAFDLSVLGARASLVDFCQSLCAPRVTIVNFSGGFTQKCWSVTRSNGAYRVIFMPKAGYFSLCVESVFGPLDIGVHGDAIGCFGSV